MSLPISVTPVRDPQTGHLISPIIAATLCIKARGALTINHAWKVDALKQGSPTFAVLRSFSMLFRSIFRGSDPGKLEQWIEDAIDSGLAFLAPFARLLRRDFAAVCNAIGLPWQQWSGGRSDQPPEDNQVRNVWPRGSGTSQSADDADQIG